jgi:ABC-2 type transport system ATP-binding protein
MRYAIDAVYLDKAGRVLRVDSALPVNKAWPGASGAKRVTLHTSDPLPALEGMSGVETDNGRKSFLYSGGAEKLLAALSGMRISDVTIAEPDVEEIFMHYYGG